MPTRRIVVALAVLLFGTFGIGVVTALVRSGDDGKPAARGAPSQSPSQSPNSPSPNSPSPNSPSPGSQATESPTPEPSLPVPSESPSPPVGVGGTPGVPEGPHMPSTGGPAALPAIALVLVGVAGGLRVARR